MITFGVKPKHENPYLILKHSNWLKVWFTFNNRISFVKICKAWYDICWTGPTYIFFSLFLTFLYCHCCETLSLAHSCTKHCPDNLAGLTCFWIHGSMEGFECKATISYYHCAFEGPKGRIFSSSIFTLQKDFGHLLIFVMKTNRLQDRVVEWKTMRNKHVVTSFPSSCFSHHIFVPSHNNSRFLENPQIINFF